MHSALFHVPVPIVQKDWEVFLMDVDSKLKSAKGVLRLSENVWLLNTQESLDALGDLISLAKKYGFDYGLLPFERAPVWLPVGFDPKPI